MNKNKIQQEANSKQISATEDEERLLVKFLDIYVNGSGKKQKRIAQKGLFTNQVTTSLAEYLEGYNVPTQFVRQISDTEMLVKNVTELPFYIVVQNFASESLAERYGYESDGELENPVIEYFLNDPVRQNPMINETHIAAFGLVSCADAQSIKRLCTKINAVLKSYFLRRELNLIQFKLEFGIFMNNLVINTDFSFETLHLQDLKSGVKYDENLFNETDAEIQSAMTLLLDKITGRDNSN